MPNKKQDKKRSYGQLPEGKSGREYSKTKNSFTGLNKINVLNSDNIVECSNIVFDEYPYIVPRKNFKNLTQLTLHGGIHGNTNSTGVYKNLIQGQGNSEIDINQEWYAASALQDFIVFLCDPNKANRMGIVTFALKSNEVGQNIVERGFITDDQYKVQHLERNDFDTTELLSQYTDKNYAYYPEVQLKQADGGSGAAYNAARIGIKYSNLTSGASDFDLSGYYKSNDTSNTILSFRHIAKNNNRYYVSNCNFNKVPGFADNTTQKYENSIAVSDKNYGADIGKASFTFSDESAAAWGTVSDDETEFVGLMPYNEVVLGFKRHFIYMVSRLKNPFLITQIAKKGCVSFNTVCEINGLIYFLSDDGVNVFNGTSCSVISNKLDMPALKDEDIAHCAGTDGRRYFLFTTYRNGDRHFYVYDTVIGIWSEWDYSLSENISFATYDYTYVEATDNTKLYCLNNNNSFDIKYLVETSKENGEWRYDSSSGGQFYYKDIEGNYYCIKGRQHYYDDSPDVVEYTTAEVVDDYADYTEKLYRKKTSSTYEFCNLIHFMRDEDVYIKRGNSEYISVKSEWKNNEKQLVFFKYPEYDDSHYKNERTYYLLDKNTNERIVMSDKKRFERKVLVYDNDGVAIDTAIEKAVYSKSKTVSPATVADTWYPLLRYIFNVKDRTFLIADSCMNIYEVDTYDRGDIETDKYTGLEWSFVLDISNRLSGSVSGISTKRIKQIRIFADMADDAEISVYARLDNAIDEYGEPHFKLFKTYTKPYTISSNGTKESVRPGITRERILITPLKTANISYQIKIGGTGYVKLYDIEVITDYGGDTYQPEKG